MISIVAEFDVKSDKIPEFLEVVKPLVEGSNNEAGCIRYELCKAVDSEKYTMIEDWEDQAAIDGHNNSPHYKAAGPLLADLLNGPTRVTLYTKVI